MIWKPLLVPGGFLLLAAAVLIHTGWLTLAPPALSFLYYCALIGGMLLAWRFHSSRAFLALLLLFLAQQAVGLLPAGHANPAASSFTVFETIALLVPLNFVLIAVMHERGFTVSGTAPVILFLFVQLVIVSVLWKTAEGAGWQPHLHHGAATASLPRIVLITFAAAGAILLTRAFLQRKPLDSALLWSLSAFLLLLRFSASERMSTAYAAAAACILATSIIENSYLLAYHDELTTLPSRRAFNDAILRLQAPFSIAVVDIDHFKRFNDTYGHDTGDQVLRLVAANLARVTGGGTAYRCGGEEFAILFPGKSATDVQEHLEQLRVTIENSEFRTRGTDRRQIPRGPDRRNERPRSRARKGHVIRQLAQGATPDALSVTVSIGVAGGTENNPYPDLVMQAADKALYRAKGNGRNRVEVAPTPRKARLKTAGIA